jgi:hypothetical protein
MKNFIQVLSLIFLKMSAMTAAVQRLRTTHLWSELFLQELSTDAAPLEFFL